MLYQHPLADRHGRHHDDELPPTVLLPQLMNCSQVDVSLTRACFHLHAEVAPRERFVARAAEHQLLVTSSGRNMVVVPVLHILEIDHYLFVGNDHVVSNARLGEKHTFFDVGTLKCALRQWLAFKEIYNGVNRRQLITLSCVKLKFHGVPKPFAARRLCPDRFPNGERQIGVEHSP